MLSEIILLMLVCLEYFISNTMKYTSIYKAYSICNAVGCSRIFAVLWRRKDGAELRGPGAALGQHRVVLLWLSPLKGTACQDCVPPHLASREKRRLCASLQNGAGRCSSTLQTSHLQQHIIMRKSKPFGLWDFQMRRSVLNSTNYQLEA